MSRQFIIRVDEGEYLVVDITGLGIKARFRPTTRFHSWAEAEKYFRQLGATKQELDAVWRSFEALGKAVLTIESAEDDQPTMTR